MAYLQSNIPYFKAWVRREYTKNLEDYHGEFLHAMVIGVTTMPNRTLSFQVIFTGCEDEENRLENPHGGATFVLRVLFNFLEQWKPAFALMPGTCRQGADAGR